jgi:iron complex outermembrane receptor protein
MSEFTNTRDNRRGFRRQLLTTVSAIALIGSGLSAALAGDDDSDRPSLWIELGGQLSRLDDSQQIFAPTFPHSPARPSMFSPSQPFERSPLYSIDETGKLSFQPDDSDWVFSASIRYGRSTSKKSVHQQSYPKSFSTGLYFSGYNHIYSFPAHANRFADTAVNNNESHIILDFQVGKDVGLGMFGNKDGSSVLNIGVRYAQFSAKTNIALKSDPDWKRLYKYISYPSAGVTHHKWPAAQPYHSNAASLTAQRSFHGIGPSISWNASAPFVGNAKDGELTFDWGLNAAVLFGRQKAKTHHQTTGRYSPGTNYDHAARPITFQGPATPDDTRVRTIIVPNVGGFAGLSFHVENFKISAGYRADLFFGAMDGGIDAAKSENVGFYGPFATVSVGLGG